MSASNRIAMARRRSQSGFTLVELMVSLVISMFIVLAALGSAQFFMTVQRQSMGAGTASGNALATVAAIKNEASQAALGFYVNGALACSSLNLSSGTHVLANNAAMTPVSISNSKDNIAQLDVLYADVMNAAAPANLATNTASSAASAVAMSFLPVEPGQAVMLTPTGDPGMPCTIKTATRVDAPLPGQGSVVYFDGTGAHNQGTFAPATYSTASALTLLGALNWSRFAVDTSGNLVMSHVISGKSAVLARNVAGFQVQYGVSDGINPTLDSWQYAEGSWANLNSGLMNRVRALRIGLVIRSDQAEKPDAKGNCSSTALAPSLLDRPMKLSGNWKCFRYKTSTAVIPLRNVLMGANS